MIFPGSPPHPQHATGNLVDITLQHGVPAAGCRSAVQVPTEDGKKLFLFRNSALLVLTGMVTLNIPELRRQAINSVP